jgi:hypothetical protein
MIEYFSKTGFLQQQQQQQQLSPMNTAVSGVQELPIDMKMIQDHMAVQALVRSYQVS